MGFQEQEKDIYIKDWKRVEHLLFVRQVTTS